MTDRDVQPRFKPAPAAPKRRAWGSTLPAPTEPINPVSERQRDIENAYTLVKRAVHRRSGRRCEAPAGTPMSTRCTGRAVEVHHIIERSLGRDDELSNLRDLCGPCHLYATEHPAEQKTIFEQHPMKGTK